MTKNPEYVIDSLAKLQEFARSLEKKLAKPITITKDPEEDSIHLATETQELHLQVFPVMNEDITEVYHVEVLTQTDEFGELLNELLGFPESPSSASDSHFSFLAKFYNKIIRRK